MKGSKPKAQAADRSGRLIVLALAVTAGVLFLCLIALIGIARSPIFAATLSTPTATKVEVFVAPTWPATWTATPRVSATPTLAPANSRTPTATLKPTSIPTPTLTQASQFVYRPVYRGCQYAAGTFVEGMVIGASGQAAGSRVSLGAAPGGSTLQASVTGGKENPGYYAFTLSPDRSLPGTFYVWVTDASGKPLSDPSLGRFTTNGILNPDDPASCWLALINFVPAP
ncbi:MAG: hypothetical protein M1482_00250 [Chloroflexi bacterium]|nr:hypothetical protein [Chloroflexota bacterium]